MFLNSYKSYLLLKLTFKNSKMLTLANTFRRSFSDIYSNFNRVVGNYPSYTQRVQNAYCYYDFEHDKKILNLDSSRSQCCDQIRSSDDNWGRRNNTWNVSSWTLLLAGMLAYLLFNNIKNSLADAEENKGEDESVNQSDKSLLLTRENFEAAKVQLKNDSPFITSLEVSFALTQIELKELYESIQDNTELGYISWHEDQVVYDFVQKIEAKLIDNNKNYSYHPNDYIHGLISRHAYKLSEVGDRIVIDNLENINEKTREYLKNWEVAEVFDDTEKSGYYSAIYINNKTHQVVLANRGTEDIIKGLLSKNSDWKTNLEEILGGQIIPGQQSWNFRATYKAVELAKERGYRLSITGHSLGAWLAELSAFYCHAYFDCRDIKAVTFDSPGSLPMMEKLQSNIHSKMTQVDLKDIEITTYLADPNPVNCCNAHLGKVYKINRKMPLTEKTESKIPRFIWERAENKIIKPVLSIEGHFLAGILDVFDPETGKPVEMKKMADWPRVEYKGKARNFHSEGKKTVNSAIDYGNFSSWTKWGLEAGVDYLVSDTTLMTLIGFLRNFNNIEQSQFWGYFEYINSEQDWEKNDKLKEQLCFDNRFVLNVKAKYREAKEDVHRLHLKRGSVDEYLYELNKSTEALGKRKDLPEVIRVQLEDLLLSFKVENII